MLTSFGIRTASQLSVPRGAALRDEETAPAVTTAAATAKAPAAHGALGNTAQMLAWVVGSPFVAAALLKYCVAAAVADAARLGVFLLPMYVPRPPLPQRACRGKSRCCARACAAHARAVGTAATAGICASRSSGPWRRARAISATRSSCWAGRRRCRRRCEAATTPASSC